MSLALVLTTVTALFAQNPAPQQVPPRRPSPFPKRSHGQKPPRVAIPAGAILRVRLNRSLGTQLNRPGDRFSATLETPLVADGVTAIPAGAHLTGVVREARPSGRLKGRAVLTLTLVSVDAYGRRLPIETSSWTRESERHRKRDLSWVGGGSAGGALIGGLAAGPVGMGVGLASGAAAGIGGALVTGRLQVRVPAETTAGFRLSRAVTL